MVVLAVAHERDRRADEAAKALGVCRGRAGRQCEGKERPPRKRFYHQALAEERDGEEEGEGSVYTGWGERVRWT